MLPIGAAVHKREPAQCSLQIVSGFRFGHKGYFRTFGYVFKCKHSVKNIVQKILNLFPLSGADTDHIQTLQRPYTDLIQTRSVSYPYKSPVSSLSHRYTSQHQETLHAWLSAVSCVGMAMPPGSLPSQYDPCPPRKDVRSYVAIGTNLSRGLKRYLDAEQPSRWLFNGKRPFGRACCKIVPRYRTK